MPIRFRGGQIRFRGRLGGSLKTSTRKPRASTSRNHEHAHHTGACDFDLEGSRSRSRSARARGHNDNEEEAPARAYRFLQFTGTTIYYLARWFGLLSYIFFPCRPEAHKGLACTWPEQQKIVLQSPCSQEYLVLSGPMIQIPVLDEDAISISIKQLSNLRITNFFYPCFFHYSLLKTNFICSNS